MLSIDRRTARSLGITAAARVVVGRATTTLTAGAKKRVRVKFTAKAKRRLARAKLVKLQVALRAVDAAGNATQLKRNVTLRKPRKAASGGHARAGAPGPVVLMQRGQLSVGLLGPAVGALGATPSGP